MLLCVCTSFVVVQRQMHVFYIVCTIIILRDANFELAWLAFVVFCDMQQQGCVNSGWKVLQVTIKSTAGLNLPASLLYSRKVSWGQDQRGEERGK